MPPSAPEKPAISRLSAHGIPELQSNKANHR